jgi:SanA protein
VSELFRRIMNALRILMRIALLGLLIGISFPLVLRAFSAALYRGRTYTVETVPEREVALIFGARVYPDGRLSAMLADRVATGADLYHAGKVRVLLMSGDNSTPDYDEPDAMTRYAIELGVPEEAIVQDYGGRRTYDSCYRARHIFGVEEAILVTQNFHLDRALFTCNALDVDGVGVFADYQRPRGYSRPSLNWSRLREIPATFVALIDVIRREPAPILGEPLPIFDDEGID